jgi:tRNA(fMet)-specific endonuclease VapC
MILLDTNICIYIINERPAQILARFRRYCAGEIGVSSIVASERAFGVAKCGSARNRSALGMFLAPLEIPAFDERCVWAYGDIRADLERRGQVIGSLDTLIAAHALALDATLVTNNAKEFSRMTGLRLENWAE